MRACLICCCRSEWEAATLFGNEECFPCLSPSASALAALSVYKTLSAIVLLHRTAAGVEETTTGALHFLSLFNNPESLVPMVDVGPGHSSRISAPPPPNPELDCQRGKSLSSIQDLCVHGQSFFLSASPLADEPLVHFVQLSCPILLVLV